MLYLFVLFIFVLGEVECESGQYLFRGKCYDTNTFGSSSLLSCPLVSIVGSSENFFDCSCKTVENQVYLFYDWCIDYVPTNAIIHNSQYLSCPTFYEVVEEEKYNKILKECKCYLTDSSNICVFDKQSSEITTIVATYTGNTLQYGINCGANEVYSNSKCVSVSCNSNEAFSLSSNGCVCVEGYIKKSSGETCTPVCPGTSKLVAGKGCSCEENMFFINNKCVNWADGKLLTKDNTFVKVCPD